MKMNSEKISLGLCVLLLVTLCFSAEVAAQPGWYLKLKQIKVLESSRQDVERIFRHPQVAAEGQSFGIEVVHYRTLDGEFTAQYSTGVCAERDPDPDSYMVETYQVKKDVLVGLLFFTKKVLYFSNLGLNKKQLDKTQRAEDPAFHYIDNRYGMDFSVVGRPERVGGIDMFASAELGYLKCSVETTQK